MIDGQVDAPAERDIVVDHHDLLVVHRPGGARAVHREMDAPRGDLVDQRHRGDAEPEPVQRRQQPQVGLQQIHVHAGLPEQQPVQERAKRVGAQLRRMPGFEGGPIVQVPADQHDATLGAQHGGLDMRQVVGTVDDRREPVGPRGLPARASWHDQRSVARSVRHHCTSSGNP